MSTDENEERANVEVDVLAGLLDFHSDRAVAHTSFLVACVFGSFTLLAIVYDLENVLLVGFLAVPYWAIAGIGIHCLQRFYFYANMSEQIKRSLERYVECIPAEEMHPLIYAELKDGRHIPLKKYENDLFESFGGISKRFREPWMRYPAAFLIFGLPFLIIYLSRLMVLLN